MALETEEMEEGSQEDSGKGTSDQSVGELPSMALSLGGMGPHHSRLSWATRNIQGCLGEHSMLMAATVIEATHTQAAPAGECRGKGRLGKDSQLLPEEELGPELRF